MNPAPHPLTVTFLPKVNHYCNSSQLPTTDIARPLLYPSVPLRARLPSLRIRSAKMLPSYNKPTQFETATQCLESATRGSGHRALRGDVDGICPPEGGPSYVPGAIDVSTSGSYTAWTNSLITKFEVYETQSQISLSEDGIWNDEKNMKGKIGNPLFDGIDAPIKLFPDPAPEGFMVLAVPESTGDRQTANGDWMMSEYRFGEQRLQPQVAALDQSTGGIFWSEPEHYFLGIVRFFNKSSVLLVACSPEEGGVTGNLDNEMDGSQRWAETNDDDTLPTSMGKHRFTSICGVDLSSTSFKPWELLKPGRDTWLVDLVIVGSGSVSPRAAALFSDGRLYIIEDLGEPDRTRTRNYTQIQTGFSSAFDDDDKSRWSTMERGPHHMRLSGISIGRHADGSETNIVYIAGIKKDSEINQLSRRTRNVEDKVESRFKAIGLKAFDIRNAKPRGELTSFKLSAPVLKVGERFADDAADSINPTFWPPIIDHKRHVAYVQVRVPAIDPGLSNLTSPGKQFSACRSDCSDQKFFDDDWDTTLNPHEWRSCCADSFTRNGHLLKTGPLEWGKYGAPVQLFAINLDSEEGVPTELDWADKSVLTMPPEDSDGPSRPGAGFRRRLDLLASGELTWIEDFSLISAAAGPVSNLDGPDLSFNEELSDAIFDTWSDAIVNEWWGMFNATHAGSSISKADAIEKMKKAFKKSQREIAARTAQKGLFKINPKDGKIAPFTLKTDAGYNDVTNVEFGNVNPFVEQTSTSSTTSTSTTTITTTISSTTRSSTTMTTSSTTFTSATTTLTTTTKIMCGNGQRRKRAGNTCVDCDHGQYSNTRTSETVCKPWTKCGQGTYKKGASESNDGSCTQCTNGRYEVARQHIKTECTLQPDCGVGTKFVPGSPTTQRVCSNCDGGQYQNLRQHKETTCKDCKDCKTGETNSCPAGHCGNRRAARADNEIPKRQTTTVKLGGPNLTMSHAFVAVTSQMIDNKVISDGGGLVQSENQLPNRLATTSANREKTITATRQSRVARDFLGWIPNDPFPRAAIYPQRQSDGTKRPLEVALQSYQCSGPLGCQDRMLVDPDDGNLYFFNQATYRTHNSKSKRVRLVEEAKLFKLVYVERECNNPTSQCETWKVEWSTTDFGIAKKVLTSDGRRATAVINLRSWSVDSVTGQLLVVIDTELPATAEGAAAPASSLLAYNILNGNRAEWTSGAPFRHTPVKYWSYDPGGKPLDKDVQKETALAGIAAPAVSGDGTKIFLAHGAYQVDMIEPAGCLVIDDARPSVEFENVDAVYIPAPAGGQGKNYSHTCASRWQEWRWLFRFCESICFISNRAQSFKSAI